MTLCFTQQSDWLSLEINRVWIKLANGECRESDEQHVNTIQIAIIT